ncbi:MAG: hypothetical protein P8Y24_10720 [Gammaproteobacteria bacterium]
MNYKKIISGGILMMLSGLVCANQAEIVDARLENQGASWTARVTIKHADTGWDHYADGWRIVDAKGNVLGHRTLYHPHENEQPFTRSLSGFTIPANLKEVYVEAHDKVHGWNPKKFKVKLNR